MKRHARLFAGIIAAAGFSLLGGCATSDQPRTSAGQVQHIVVCWLKPGGDREAVIHTANDFAKLPGVLEVSAGCKLASPMPDVDSSYDIALVINFDGEDALHAAEKSPAMQGIMDGPFKENVAKSVTYDSVLQNYFVGKVFAQENEAATLQRRAAALKQQQSINPHK